MPPTQLDFRPELVWVALMDLLTDQLGDCDVAAISNNDFNGEELVLSPPSIRTFFGGERGGDSDTQRLSYDATANFLVICGDLDASSPANQSIASLTLASDVKAILIGARIQLPTGELSEPVRWIATEPVPVKDFGTAYALGFEVPGIAQFDGPNAHPAPATDQPEDN